MSMLNDFQRLMRPDDESCIVIDTRIPGGRRTTLGDDTHFSASAMFRAAHAALVEDLIARIHMQLPEFFERLVLDVLLSMGYGKRRHDMAQCLGRTGDGGVDGLICLDELGLDQVYFQAKRLRPGIAVPIAEVRDFVGSLAARQASKGVFVTTTHFPQGAADYCTRISRRVVLIDGSRLAELMIRHNIGVRVKERFELKRVDPGYFTAAPAIHAEEPAVHHFR